MWLSLLVILAMTLRWGELSSALSTTVACQTKHNRVSHLQNSDWISALHATAPSTNENGGGSDFPGGVSSTWQGAGLPRADLQPEQIPPLLMEALQNNDIPVVDAGLMSMWEFAGGNTQYIFEKNRTDFISSAHETADAFPTSFYGISLHGKSWEMETPINRVGGPTGWIATQVMKTTSSDGRMRRWQWELRQNRRPPNQGAWLIESIASSDRKGNFEPE